MRKIVIAAAGLALGALAAPVFSQTKVAIGYSGWTGFAPLTLAKEAGIFKKHGLDVDMKKIPQKDRHLAIASGDVQCAATTVETWVVWNANGVATKQIFQMDKSYGADGMAVRNGIAKIADLKRPRRARHRTSRSRGSSRRTACRSRTLPSSTWSPDPRRRHSSPGRTMPR